MVPDRFQTTWTFAAARSLAWSFGRKPLKYRAHARAAECDQSGSAAIFYYRFSDLWEMAEHKKHIAFKGKILILGFGAVGQGTLPLLLRHIDMPKENVSVITAEDWGREIAEEYGVAFRVEPMTRDNYRPHTGPGTQGRRLSVQCFFRRVQPRADRVLQRARHHVPGRLHRALGRRPSRHLDPRFAPHELRVSRSGAGDAQEVPERSARGADARRQPGSGLAFPQAGAAQPGPGHRPARRPRRRPRRHGRGSRGTSVSKSSRSPSATARSARLASSGASSSTPGRAARSWANRCNRPSWAGARTSGTGRTRAWSSASAAAARFT